MSIAPYFVEYGFYAANHGGAFTVVKSREPDFGLDIAAIEAALTPKTRVLLLNSPNNPSGAIYSIAELTALAEMLVRVSKERDKPIYLVSDEPYRFLTYDGARVPSTLPLYPYSVVCSSFSKNLGLAGERVGYALVNPEMPGKDELIDGLILANRILGFVNAPAIGQTIAARAINETVDTGIYHKRRDLMADVLDDAGFDYAMPKGGFYFFPKAPGGDDVAFVSKLQEELILAVPGSGFGFPGYFRLTFCVDEAVIARSHDGFARAMKGR
jgi:aspartate aminotransferase